MQASLHLVKAKYLLLKKRHEERWDSMKRLIDSEGCRMNYILNYFGEDTSNPCGMCDNCVSKSNTESKTQLIDKQREINERY